MKFMKRSLTLMLAGLMAVSMVACGDSKTDGNTSKDTSVTTDADGREMVGNTYKTGLPIVKETETFKCWFSGSANDFCDDVNDKDVFKELGDTNITIDWTVETADVDEKLGLVLATSATMPDFVKAWPSEQFVGKNYKNMMDITDMMEEWAPNIYGQTMEALGSLDDYKQADGRIYSLPAGVYAEPTNSVVGVTNIKNSWIEAVGMEMPKTTEELKTLLTAFRDQDANENGDPNDEIPLLICDKNWASQIMTYAGPWGIAGNSSNDYDLYYLIKDGKFVPTIDTQAFRDFLTFYHELAVEKLVNSDAFTMDVPTFNSINQTEVAGMFSSWTEDINEWSPLPVLEAPGYEGQGVKAGEIGYRTANMNGFMITRICENPEAILRWWDEWHKDSYTKQVSRDGAPTEFGTWIVEDGVFYVHTPEKFATGISKETEHNYTYGFRGAGAVMFEGEAAIPVKGSGTSDANRYEYIEFYKDYLLTDFLPKYKVDDDTNEILADLRVELEDYMDTFIANAIVSGTGLDDAGWQKHIDTLNNDLGLQEWIDWNQSYYDGEFKN